MRPRFNRELKMDESGTLVVGEGPFEIVGIELEGYFSVFISQEETDERTKIVTHKASGHGSEEWEPQLFLDAVSAAKVRMNTLDEGAEEEDVQEAGPLWECVVEARKNPFKPGKAEAEGWIAVELPDGHKHVVMWTDDVELVPDPAVNERRRTLDEERCSAAKARASAAAA